MQLDFDENKSWHEVDKSLEVEFGRLDQVYLYLP